MKKCQINVKDNRITLSSALTPHFGYELEAGVACTFTLDFESILGVFCALGMKDEYQIQSSERSKLQLLRGIKRYADKLSFYCNDCSVTVPRNQRVINGLMDSCVFEVNPTKAPFPHDGIFHPKVWILLFTPTANNEGARPYIKVIISSRNLSKSSNLDFAVVLEAAVKDKATNESRERTKPMIDWLDYLAHFTPERKMHNIDTLKDFVSRSEGFRMDYNDVYSDCWLQPLGISEEYTQEDVDLLNCDKDWLIVVSPFLGEDFIAELTENGTTPDKCALLTRKSSLTQSIWNSFSNTYGLRAVLNNNEILEQTSQTESDGGDVIQYRDIHAKMYFYRSNGRNMLLTGSANATSQAFNQNVEFMLQLELPGSARSVTYESLCEELFHITINGQASESPFEEIELKESDSDLDSESDENEVKAFKRRDLCERIQDAEVQQEGDSYTIIVRALEPIDPSVHIAPLNARDSEVELTAETRIPNLSLNQLSNFYVISTPNDRFIKIINTKNIPVQQRNRAIDNAIIENKSDFYKMIELILADVPASAIAPWEVGDPESLNGSYEGKNAYIPKRIYERLLEAAASNAEPLKELKSFIDSLSDNKVDSQLVAMLETFTQALSPKEK